MIELTEEVVERRGWKLRLLKAVVFCALFATGSYYANFYGQKAYDYAEAQVMDIRSRLVTIVEPNKSSVEELINAVAQAEGISPTLLSAIADQESSGGRYLYAFEPSQFERRAAIDARYSENERRMRASSHGVMHVMGYIADEVCKVHWSELYDRFTNFRCAVQVLREKGRRVSTLRELLAAYNGSGPRADQYAQEVLARIAEKSTTNLVKGIL